MTIKKHAGAAGNIHAAWLHKTEEDFNKEGEKKEVTDYFKRQQILARLKTTGLKIRQEVKAKLGDDLRAFLYVITKIDKQEGVVTLKNERGTIRKVTIFDALFGAVQLTTKKSRKR